MLFEHVVRPALCRPAAVFAKPNVPLHRRFGNLSFRAARKRAITSRERKTRLVCGKASRSSCGREGQRLQAPSVKQIETIAIAVSVQVQSTCDSEGVSLGEPADLGIVPAEAEVYQAASLIRLLGGEPELV